MRSSFYGLIVAALTITLTSGAPSRLAPHHVKESVDYPLGWEKHSVPSPHQRITLRIALPQPNFAALEQHIYEVSNPYHHRYGLHLSKEEVNELVAPHPDSINMVDNWLAAHGIDETDLTRSPARDWVTIRVPISVAEEMLDTTYYVWKHIESGEIITRTTSYSLPRNLHAHIEVVHPTTAFGRLSGLRPVSIPQDNPSLMQFDSLDTSPIVDIASRSTVDASCHTNITINCILQIYNAEGYKASATSGNSIGVVGLGNEFANKEDLKAFYKLQRPEAVNSSFNFISVQGAVNSQNISEAGEEAALDVEFAFGISYPIPATYYLVAPFVPVTSKDAEPHDPFGDWVSFALDSPESPQLTISTSYVQNEQNISPSLARRICAQYAQLGALGVSLLFASGDFGVGGESQAACLSNDGKNTTMFIPTFPSTCPYVTSVGATTGIPEVAALRFPSGGGFSNVFDRPSYQDAAVKAYLETLPNGTYEGLFNPNGRAYPDVSALGDRFSIIVGGSLHDIGGTSASTPTFAGIVALLNDVRLSAGKPPLGFLNPLLYSKGLAGLNDITIGNNAGCNTTGFEATTGWDPVTGLGSPDFSKMREIVLSD